jgi:ribosomal protein L19
MIDKIEIIRRAKVRRAKLYHIRKKAAKEISRQMRKVQNIRTMEEEIHPTLSSNYRTPAPEAAPAVAE